MRCACREIKTPLFALLAALAMQVARADIVTVVHPDETFPATKTVVWSPVFQAAWDKMNSQLEGPAIRVEPPNQLMTSLDSFRWEPATVMPDGSWKTWCGPATRHFLDEVNREAVVITKDAEGPFSLGNESDSSLAFFGILDHEVVFKRPFYRSKEVPMTFHATKLGQPVHFFGVRGQLSGGFRGSVRVLKWGAEDGSHALQIRSTLAEDSIILYLPPAHQDFATACRSIRSWLKPPETSPDTTGAANDPFLHDEDDVRIPCLTLESKTDFATKLVGTRHHQDSPVPWTISRAEQFTRFQLDEKGARIKVVASGAADPFGELPPTTPREFWYDSPFFVFLWRDNAEWPYFAAWIGDESALEPFKPE